MNSSGDITGGAVAVGALKSQYHIASAVTLEPLVGDRRAGDVTAQPFELVTLVGVASRTAACRLKPCALAHKAGEADSPRPETACRLNTFSPRAWPKGNAVGAGARLQGHERLIGLDAGQVAYALLFNEDALTSQQPHQRRDDRGE
jgi:hypothetical protein